MYDFIKGRIAERSAVHVVIEAGGIGYFLHISLNTYSSLEGKEEAKLNTYLHVREDAMLLFGFADQAERALFLHLISVNGVGVNTARIILSSMQADEVKTAIVSENDQIFKKVKGVGPKTAKRIILDLKDKMLKEGVISKDILVPQHPGIMNEAASALNSLGFQKNKVQKLLNIIISNKPEINQVEDLVKEALKQLT